MKVSDLITILSAVVALAAAVSEPALEAVFPGHGAYVAGILSLSGIVAGVVIRVLSNPTDAPSNKISTSAIITTPDGTPTGAVNVISHPVTPPTEGAPATHV